MENWETVVVETDLLICGGGMSACGAAVESAYWAKKNGLKVTMVEKSRAHPLRRRGHGSFRHQRIHWLLQG